ncbi:hypothetical protein [Pontibacter beigongshangensis]|uniref:hypothetical protein n=1 Tax=Pontibacter beigongshangensis TaxID=2574733 RepID=UPI0016505F99|nr:hypothetical protein [Pontibacter beigongshangensis]
MFKQFIKEFYIQFIISCIWATYKVSTNDESQNDLTDFITNFSTSFFLLSWFLGQFVRISKTQKVDSSFDKVLRSLENIVKDLETTGQVINQNLQKTGVELMNKLLGKDSFVYMTIGSINASKEEGDIVFIVKGESPVYEVGGDFIDLNSYWTTNIRHKFHLGNHPPNVAIQYKRIKLDKENGVNINTFFTSRGGLFNQGLKMRFANDKWYTATQVGSDKVLYFQIDSGFPIHENDTEIKSWIEMNEKMTATNNNV